MIKGSLALMFSHGQRPRKQLGHHIAIIEFAQKTCPGAQLRRSFCLTVCAASATTPSTMWRLSVIQMPRKLSQPQSNSRGLLRLISKKNREPALRLPRHSQSDLCLEVGTLPVNSAVRTGKCLNDCWCRRSVQSGNLLRHTTRFV
jgi:hypothetical protein